MKAVFNRLADGLKGYFKPPSVEPPPVEDERELAQLGDVQRRLRIYLRALWGCEFVIKQGGVDMLGYEAKEPFIENFVINLPAAYAECTADSGRPVSGAEIYRAASAHAAAHLMYTQKRFSAKSLDKLHVAMISLVEDARVEALSVRQFPGLHRLWAGQHIATPQHSASARDYLNRLARALLDESYQDDDPWVCTGREWFGAAVNLEDERISTDIGLKLADAFRAKKLRLDSQPDVSRALYRDDNRFLWRRRGEPMEVVNPYFRSNSTIGMEKEGRKKPKNKAELVIDDGAARRTATGTFSYPEWNYRSKVEDQAWVTLRERTPFAGRIRIVNAIADENRQLIARMKALLRAVREGPPHRQRKLEDGDEIDINAAIRARIALKSGMQPDARIMMRTARKTRDLSVLVLLDLSRSMNNPLPGREQTALQLTQQVCVLFAEALEAVGDPFALHGFYSDSRHFVEYFRLKNFDQPYDDGVKENIAGIMGKRGTRMGAAIRHATHHLNEQKSGKKLLLILTDGEPSDIDVPDRKYLHDDTKKAVEAAKRDGVHTFCITLDPAADQYVSRIFGAMNYLVVDHIRHLPEKVLLIYAGLTR